MKKIFLILFLVCFSSFVLANSPPRLINGGANPQMAPPGTIFIYRVTYVDEDGDAPSYVRVYFSNLGPKEMKKISGDYKTGTTYEYSMEQDQGYEYYFEASDGKSTARLPEYEGGGLSPVNIFTDTPENNKVYLFYRENNQPLWAYNTGKDWIHNIDISSDGKYFAVKTSDNIYLFSKENNNPLWKYPCLTSDAGNNKNLGGEVAISSDGNYIAGACANDLYLFSKQSSQPLWSYREEDFSIYSIDMSSDGNYLVVGTSMNDQLILFSKNNNKPVWKFKIEEGDFHGLAISPDGNYIAAGTHCPDRKAYLFSKNNNQPLVSYMLSDGAPVWAADVSDNGYAVYGLDGLGMVKGKMSNVFIFSHEKNEPLRMYSIPGWARSVSTSGDSKFIAVGCAGGYVYLFDKDSDQELWKYKAGERVGTVSISKNGEYISAGSKDKKIYTFSKENNEPLWSYDAGGWVNSVAISSDGKYVVAGTGVSQYIAEGHEVSTKTEDAQMTPVCGDGVCISAEQNNCPQDCTPGEKVTTEEMPKEGMNKETVCGNGLCEPPEENEENCIKDCCGENCKDNKEDTEIGRGDGEIIRETFEEETEEKEGIGLLQSIINFFRRLFG